MSTRDRNRAEVGIIAGYMLRLARESIPRTQEGLAEDLAIDLGTVQGWESGRRPLVNIRAGTFLSLRRRLAALGADRVLLGLFDAAMDADRILTAVLRPPATAAEHPLAQWVQHRETAHMVAWAARGITPPALLGRHQHPRRGPTPASPVLAPVDRASFFTHLRHAAETAHHAGERALLLRRQALYLTSYDPSPDAQDWAANAMRDMRPALAVRGWSHRWIEARTTATVAARQGDPEPIRHFIDHSLVADDTGETANLAYWAYWLGAMPTTQPDDTFMRDPGPSPWNPIDLLRLLTDSLHDAPGTVDLYVHSLAALLEAHPWLPAADRAVTRRLAERSTQLLDDSVISRRSHQDLESVQYRLKQTN